MAKTPTRQNKQWSNTEVTSLARLAAGNTPTPIIALKLDRSEAAVRSKAVDQSISLKPPNQSPYSRRSK